ncbi:MAG: hypothetical protein IIT65_11860 [Lachnospiraceae bacterium]|nr:hypothetical protein [Lachnospiraceae bacterium]
MINLNFQRAFTDTFLGRVLAERKRITGTDTVLKTKLFGLKVRHFNNSCLLIAFTRSIHALFSKDETGTSPWRFFNSKGNCSDEG